MFLPSTGYMQHHAFLSLTTANLTPSMKRRRAEYCDKNPEAMAAGE